MNDAVVADSEHTGGFVRVLPFLLLAVIGGCWALGSPPNAGPDEPAHILRAGALVRGADASDPDAGLPAWLSHPNPACFAFQPNVPAGCVTEIPVPPAADVLGEASYPWWGDVLPGVATFVPGADDHRWLIRLVSLLAPVVLLGAALRLARSGPGAMAPAVCIAMTPLVWFSVSTVNPSSLVLAGAIVFWVFLGVFGRDRRTPRLDEQLLGVVALAAMVLPRRDGMFWVGLALALVALTGWATPSMLWRRLGVPARCVVVGVLVVSAAWSLIYGAALYVAAIAFPVVVWLAEVAHRWADGNRRRWAAVLAVVGTGTLAAAGLATVVRPSGFQTALVRQIVGQTGNNLIEAIGVVGWLDTLIPWPAVVGCCVAIGGLVVAARRCDGTVELVLGTAIVVAAIAASWIVELSLEQYRGQYWQGRYYLPLLVGLPVVVSSTRRPVERDAGTGRVVRGALWTAVAVWNVSFAAALRRWAVGQEGGLMPWSWPSYGEAVHPLVLIGCHLAASVALGLWALGRSVPAPEEARS